MIVNNVKVEFNGNVILDNVSFKLNTGDKVGLVGKNGSGKSTLLKTISNNKGNVKTDGETIGYLKQEIEEKYYEYSIFEYIKEVTKIKELESTLDKLSLDLTEDKMEEYTLLYNEFLSLDGYNFESNLEIIKNGLNLRASLNAKIKTLSGGEKIKVLLMELLISNRDILLLDEPTNNLDMEAITWLEKYLKQSNKKMIIVSHDEIFLNNIVNKIFELVNGKIKEYNMTYNNYLFTKENEYNREREEYYKTKEEKEKLKSELEKAKRWVSSGNTKRAHNDNDKIANNYAKERTSTSNIKRITRNLNKLNVISFEEKKPINVFFELDDDKGNKDIVLDKVICGYDTFKTKVIDLTIPYGVKLQINGYNGSGKTTLIKTILGEIEPISGKVSVGSKVKMGYISQNTLLEGNNSVIEYLTENMVNVNYSLVFTLLEKIGISYEDKDKIYSKLSPGERTRLSIIKLALLKTNVLILDEVTNHLDKEALNLIYELIRSYEGTVISISHNRKYNEILDADVSLDMGTGVVENLKLTKNL
jgi:ATP-binding cassette subfamily F protein 3